MGQQSAVLWGVIPAAGTGTRFSRQHLKQYQSINGQTVLQHSVDALQHLPLQGCMIALAADDDFGQYLEFPAHVRFCQGGATRSQSVGNALQALDAMGAKAEDYVLVHDAARPCLHREQLELIQQFCEQGADAAIIATPVRDSLKSSTANQFVSHSVERDGLWQAQTPQIARLGLLKAALQHCQDQHHAITDEAGALEFYGATIQILAGRGDNIKITYPDDLALAAAILQSHQGTVA